MTAIRLAAFTLFAMIALGIWQMSSNHWLVLSVGVALALLGIVIAADAGTKLRNANSAVGHVGGAATTSGGATTTSAKDDAAPPSMLGPENREDLEKMGFRPTEFANFRRWDRTVPASGEHFKEVELFLVHEGQRVAFASVFDIHSECAWKSKTYDVFTYENNRTCDLTALLRGEKYQERLRPATNLVFLGTESFPDSPIATDCHHGALSNCRAIELARATYRAKPDNWTGRQYWALDLGTAKTNDPVHEFDQRRAITIGIKEKVVTVPLELAIREIVMSTEIDNAILAGFSESDSAVPVLLTKQQSGAPAHGPE